MNTKASSKKSSVITCYVVAYDIPDDKRRTKIHKVLLGFGKWTQYSLFECFLSRRDLILLQSKLIEHLMAREDSVRFYPLCASCVSKVETVGGPLPSNDALYVV
jgi:CRISPR-associated protein Cas2